MSSFHDALSSDIILGLELKFLTVLVDLVQLFSKHKYSRVDYTVRFSMEQIICKIGPSQFSPV